MFAPLQLKYASLLRLSVYLGAGITAIVLWTASPERPKAYSQEASSEAPGPSGEPAPAGGAPVARSEARRPQEKSINILALAVAGGIFMIPIAGMSVRA